MVQHGSGQGKGSIGIGRGNRGRGNRSRGNRGRGNRGGSRGRQAQRKDGDRCFQEIQHMHRRRGFCCQQSASLVN
jgi:hypothetical protein